MNCRYFNINKYIFACTLFWNIYSLNLMYASPVSIFTSGYYFCGINLKQTTEQLSFL